MVGVTARGLFALIARLVLAWVFINAGLPKIQDPVAFAASIEAYRVIGGTWALAAATVLPWLELVIGVGLVTPWLRRASAAVMVLLLSLFIALHLSAWARGLNIDCGCFGQSAGSPDYHGLILRNLALLAISLFILRLALRNKNASGRIL